jgi:hypothetical protein
MRRLRSFLPVLAFPAAVVAAAACGNKGDGRDTIAVPAAAVDTTPNTNQQGGAAVTAGPPGAGTAATGATAAQGVDTPITRKLRAEDSARRAAAGTGTKRP